MKLKLYHFLIILLVLFSSCKFQHLLKSADYGKKYDMAIKYYETKDFYRALQLFDQLTTFYRGTEKAQLIYYYYAYCYFEQKDYMMANYYFKRYTENFPTGKYAEECAYQAAYCNYLSSPDYMLDQSSTYDAIKDLQMFINTYPESPRIEECNNLIDQLRDKLELKAFHIARLYFRMSEYQAAITSFYSLLKDFPDTKHKENIEYLMVKSYYSYGTESIPGKRKERIESAIKFCDDFSLEFPKSEHLKEVKSIKEKLQEEIKNQS